MKKRFFLFAFVFFLILWATAQVPSYVPTDGLVGWYPFTGNANDLSVNVNHGMFISGATTPTSTSDRFGNSNSAYLFDGIDDYIWVSDAPFTTYPFTISAWVYIEDISKSYIVGLGEIGSNDLGKFSIYSTYNEGLRVGSDGAWYHQSDSAYININTWINITITYEYAIGPTFYINGAKYNDLYSIVEVGGIIWPLNNTGFNIGKHTGTGSSKYMKGKIDDLGFWNRALTPAEITALSGTVGVDEVSKSVSVSVYPNPASDYINIKTDFDAIGSTYYIVNSVGQVVVSGEVTDEDTVVDLSDFSTGIYLVRIGDTVSKFYVN